MNKKSLGQGLILIALIICFVIFICLNGCGSNSQYEYYELKVIPAASIEQEETQSYNHKTISVVYTDPEIIDSYSVYTDEEIDLIARVLKNKGGDLPTEGKLAIMATIINRVNSDQYPNTIEQVIKGDIEQYSLSKRGEPDDDCYLAIDLYVDGDYPDDMFYFSMDQPYYLGYPFMRIGNMYFSTEGPYGD